MMSLFVPPHICIRANNGTCRPLDSKLSLSAAMTTSTVLSYSMPDAEANTKKCFHQFSDAGSDTLTPSDDHFYLKDCLHANT
jgi:hypothetical protein